MKKILLSASLLLASMMTAFAQNAPDASQWQKGDEISSQVGFGNLSFEEPDFDSWTLESSTGSFTKTGGLFEVYSGSDVDLYQYVQLPAGMYKVECQGYYRIGTSWDFDPKTFGTADWVDEAQLYVQNGAYDIESEAFTAGRTFKTPLMPRLFLNQQTQLYEDEEYTIEDGEKKYTAGWNRSDGNYGEGKGWGPCSVPGSLIWFQAGLYAPYVDEDYEDTKIKYNTTDFFVTEAGYVKIGVSKIATRADDSFMVTNFKLYYQGEVNPATAELLALQAEVQEYYDQIKKIKSKYSEGMIYSLIDDAISDFEDEYGTPDEIEAEDIDDAKDYLIDLIAKAQAAEASLTQLQKLLPTAQLLYNTTDYAGKADYEAAITAANNCLDPNYEMTEDDDFDSFKKAYENLVTARITYLLTQEKVNGAYDFSSAINYPFFCNNEYTPKWDATDGCFKYTDDIETTWVATYAEKSVKEVMSAHPDWIDIASNVTWTQKSGVTGEWIFNHQIRDGWMGGIDNVTMQHGYTAVGAWSANPTGGYQEMRQTITGLPAGYYAMGALFINAGANPAEYNQYVYISAGAEPDDATMEKAQFTHKNERWWWGTDQTQFWRTSDWESLRTNMIQVGEDGTVTIGSRSNGFYAVTGFQLYYYGETPDFAALVNPSLLAAQANVEANLLWAGDKAAANAILAAVDPEAITDGAGYQAALEAIAKANAYVATASAVVNAFNDPKTGNLAKFEALEAQQTDPNAIAIVQCAWATTLAIGDGDNDTYELATQNDKDYAAYVHYLDYRSAMGDLINNAEVKKVIDEQNAYLFVNFANDQELPELEKALATPYNKALLESLNASGASLDNPVDITALLINPKFDEGTKGWMGEPTVTGDAIAEELGAAEKWNCDFDVYQTIYSLPAGCYKVECQALYRDAGDATKAYDNWWYTAMFDMDMWVEEGLANARLYANQQATIIGSIAAEIFTEPTMNAFRDKTVKSEEGDENGNELWLDHWIVTDSLTAQPLLTDEDKRIQETGEASGTEWKWLTVAVDPNGWYWDTKVDDVGDISYYPASLMGASKRFAQSPEAYKTEVVTMVEEGGSLQLGVKNVALIANHWCVFDNFKLYYLGTEAPTGINEAKANGAKAVAGYFSLNGAKQNGLQKGFNIVKMQNGDVRKVYNK